MTTYQHAISRNYQNSRSKSWGRLFASAAVGLLVGVALNIALAWTFPRLYGEAVDEISIKVSEAL